VNQLGAVVIAAGYGSVSKENGSPFPKVLEAVGGKSMVIRAIKVVRESGLGPCVVVVNPESGNLIVSECERAGITGIHYEVQPERTGTADALSLSIPWLHGRGITDFVATYADMPLWTPETVALLAKAHIASRAVISKVTVKRTRRFPELDRYGRVLRDGNGHIARVVEIDRANPQELKAKSVNPSLWAWNGIWFLNHVRRVKPVPRGDGRPAERHLPPLVGVAYEEGEWIMEVPLANPAEALGVNNAAELARVRVIAEAAASSCANRVAASQQLLSQ